MSVSRHSFAVFRRDVFLFATNLITGVVVARTLGPAAMGTWVILQLVPSYAEVFFRTKFDIAAVYFLGRGKYRLHEVVWTLNLLAFGSGSLIAVCGILNIGWLQKTMFARVEQGVAPLIAVMLVQIPL